MGARRVCAGVLVAGSGGCSRRTEVAKMTGLPSGFGAVASAMALLICELPRGLRHNNHYILRATGTGVPTVP